MSNIEYVLDWINDEKIGVPIYVSELAVKLAEKDGMDEKKAGAAVSVAVKRIMDQGMCQRLRAYQKGIYYLAEKTPFGETEINKEMLISHKYLLPDIGYETGYTVLYEWGLTTQIPKSRVITTNRAKECQRYDAALDVYVRPPKVEVTEKNMKYLQVLDAYELIEKAPVDNEDPYGRLAQILVQHDLEYGMLLALADKYYSKDTIIKIAHTAATDRHLDYVQL